MYSNIRLLYLYILRHLSHDLIYFLTTVYYPLFAFDTMAFSFFPMLALQNRAHNITKI